MQGIGSREKVAKVFVFNKSIDRHQTLSSGNLDWVLFDDLREQGKLNRNLKLISIETADETVFCLAKKSEKKSTTFQRNWNLIVDVNCKNLIINHSKAFSQGFNKVNECRKLLGEGKSCSTFINQSVRNYKQRRSIAWTMKLLLNFVITSLSSTSKRFMVVAFLFSAPLSTSFFN